MAPTEAKLAVKREQIGERLLAKGSTSIEFVWNERDERLVRGMIVWAALERDLAIPLLGFHGIREAGRRVCITATIEGSQENGR